MPKAQIDTVKIIKILRIVMACIRAARAEVIAARQPDSDGGEKVTRREAGEIALAALGAAVDPVADILADED